MPKEPIAKQSKKLADSAQRIRQSSELIEDSADRRTELAGDRTIYAAERTYAAWVRTGLFALASGAGAHTVLDGIVPDWLIVANGTVLVLFSVFCYVVAVWRRPQVAEATPQPDTLHIPKWMFVLVDAFLALVSLAVLFGLWRGALRR